jgi:hypothetical protein
LSGGRGPIAGNTAKRGLGLFHPGGLVFGLWLLSTAAAALLIAGAFHWLGELTGLAAVPVSLILLGIPQGILLHRYGHRIIWWHWAAWTLAATFIVSPPGLLWDLLIGAGGGLNPETDVRGCLFTGIIGLGFLFGFIQMPKADLRTPWACLQTLAVTAAVIVGVWVGFGVYPGYKVEFGYRAGTEAERASSTAAGFLVGMVVYGLITGLAVAWSVRSAALAQARLPEGAGSLPPPV